MEKKRFVDRILETENLTDELEDAEAKWLLDWGIARLDAVLEGITDPDAAGEQVNALMAVMRKINRIVGNYSSKDPKELAEDLAALKDLHAQAFKPAGLQPRAVSTGSTETDAARLSRLSPREALEFLTQGPSQPGKPV